MPEFLTKGQRVKISSIVKRYKDGNLILQILIGIIFGAILGYIVHVGYFAIAQDFLSLFGNLFVGALKAVAPILVFALVVEAIATKEFSHTSSKGLKRVILLYLIGTFLASLCAVLVSFAVPIELVLQNAQDDSIKTPSNIKAVLLTLAFKIVDNPINALVSGNFIGILAWATGFGIALRHSNQTTKQSIIDCTQALTKIVHFVIALAPFGIFGLVGLNVAQTGFNALGGYLKLIIILVATMFFVAFVINALIVFIVSKKNPYPLILTCLKESAITAFFTRSSAANIPVNMRLCQKLKLDESIYAISIPLGATVNMAGAAVTIAILTLSCVYTLGIEISFGAAFVLSLVASIAACGTSGVAGGSLMLIPLACSLFGISNDIAMQVVAVGFIISVVQDSVETALNSSTDVLFTAAVACKINEKG